MLDVRRLRLLSELARRGTIASVARSVGYSPSAVSQSLARLEREAGMPLLERDGRHVRLTPAARRLVTRTDRVLAELDAAEAELAAEHGTVRGDVVIGAFPSAAARLVVPAVHALSARFADLACAIHEHEPEDGIGLLRAGELDLLVSEHYDDVDPAPAGGLEQHLLVAEPLLLVLPATPAGAEDAVSAVRGGDSATAADDAVPAADGGDVVPLASLAGEPWIGGLGETQFAGALEHACRAAGLAPRFVHRADEAWLYQALVAAGLGVGLLPALACTPFPGVRYARAEPAPPRRHIVALLRRGAARRPALAALLAALRETAAS